MASGFSAFIWLIQFVTPKGIVHKGRPQLRGRKEGEGRTLPADLFGVMGHFT